MNHCAIQQKHAFAACEEMRSSIVCPKPRRVGLLNSTFNDPIIPRRWHLSHQSEMSDSNERVDLLDIILSKGGGYGIEEHEFNTQPPFFSGSPPSRAANPLIHDTRFRNEKINPISPLNQITIPPSPTTANTTRISGFARVNFDNNPAVRVEGFECLNRDRRNRSIPTFA